MVHGGFMRLDNAAIVSGENRIVVTAGWVIGVHRDRRKSKGEVRVGDSARRRKPPSEIADLVGTGRLWVARGEFEILETDAKRHAKGVTMRLVVGDLLMYIVSLTPLELAGKGSMRWAFRALFVPTEQQLSRLPVEELTRPSHATLEEQAFIASHHPRVPVAAPAPIVFVPPPFAAAPKQPAPSETAAIGIDLHLEFDEPEEAQEVKPEVEPATKSDNGEKAALMAYLQSLAYPEESSG